MSRPAGPEHPLPVTSTLVKALRASWMSVGEIWAVTVTFASVELQGDLRLD